MRYTVATQDVDGRAPARKYKTFAAARKYFEEMVGYSMECAIAEQFYMREPKDLPPADAVEFLRAVSSYGTVVVYRAIKEA